MQIGDFLSMLVDGRQLVGKQQLYARTPNPMWCSRESGLCGLEGGMEGGRVPALVPLPVTSLGDSTKPLTSSGKVTNDTMYTVIYKNE